MSTPDMSVLLVDNDPYMCEIFGLVLDYHHVPHHIVQEADEALAILTNHKVAVVIVASYLSNLYGCKWMDMLRALAPESKFIVTSARYSEDGSLQSECDGFDGFIAKPFVISDLVPYLKRVVETDRSEDLTDS